MWGRVLKVRDVPDTYPVSGRIVLFNPDSAFVQNEKKNAMSGSHCTNAFLKANSREREFLQQLLFSSLKNNVIRYQ